MKLNSYTWLFRQNGISQQRQWTITVIRLQRHSSSSGDKILWPPGLLLNLALMPLVALRRINVHLSFHCDHLHSFLLSSLKMAAGNLLLFTQLASSIASVSRIKGSLINNSVDLASLEIIVFIYLRL